MSELVDIITTLDGILPSGGYAKSIVYSILTYSGLVAFRLAMQIADLAYAVLTNWDDIVTYTDNAIHFYFRDDGYSTGYYFGGIIYILRHETLW